MKVFISWSKDLSREVSHALNWWLPQVLQSVEPFLSSADIEAGRRWSSTIAGELKDSNFGILCVTRENRHEPWLNFEAGALAKNLDESYVVPLLIDLSPADLEGPLAQFQAITTLDKDGVATMLRAIDGLTAAPLGEARLSDAVDVWWPRLEPRLSAARQTRPNGARSETPLRDQRDLLEEVLTIVRNLSDNQPRMTSRSEGPVNLRKGQHPSDQHLIERLLSVLGRNGVAIDTVTLLGDRKISVAYANGSPTDSQVALAHEFAEEYGLTIVDS